MKIISVDTMRSLERRAAESGVDGSRLMRRAGTAAAALIDGLCEKRFRRVVFFCGGGNNAGDAIVCAAALRTPHILIPFRPLDTLKNEAALAFREYGSRINIASPGEFDFVPGDVIVDALAGIGFSGTELRAPLADALKIMADSGRPVIAFDLPSGLNGDTGNAAAGTLPADVTITFGLPKQGLFLNGGPRYCGKLLLAPIGVEEFPAASALPYSCFTACDVRRIMPRPAPDAHKNSRGAVLMLCGSTDYPGAAVLASKGALHFAGLVRTVSVDCPNMPPLPAALIARLLPPAAGGSLPPEALKTCAAELSASQVLCAGCGWGSHVSSALLKEVLKFQGPVILDADALNLLARTPGVWNFRSDAVLTPHPGEARRLAEGFGISTGGSREEFASRLASRLGAIVALKGFRTCVAAPDGRVSVNTSGGPELAMAGSGDVLAGIIAAFAAQCEELFDAVKLAVYFHGAAGDRGRGTVTADELPRLAAECAHDQTWW